MRPINIVHVLAGLNRGGVETWLLQIAQRLDPTRYRLSVLISSVEEGVYEEELKQLGIRILRVASPRTVGRFLRELHHVLRECGPFDVMHSHVWLASGLVVYGAQKAGVPVRIVHSRTSMRLTGSMPHRRAYAVAMQYMINKYATHVIGVSYKAGQRLFYKSRWHREGIVLPSSIDCGVFTTKVDSKAIRAEFGFAETDLVMGHIGSFRPPKNHAFLLELYTSLRKTRIVTHLLLVGDGPLRAEVKSRAEGLGLLDKIRFVDSTERVAPILKGAIDVFVLPSLWEGMGRVVVEAQAAGLPCVISDVVPEEVDVVPDLVYRESLCSPSSKWAQTIAWAITADKPSQDDALALVKESMMNIDNSISVLQHIYDQAIYNA